MLPVCLRCTYYPNDKTLALCIFCVVATDEIFTLQNIIKGYFFCFALCVKNELNWIHGVVSTITIKTQAPSLGAYWLNA